MDFYEARKELHNCVPGTFGIQLRPLSETITKEDKDLEIGTPGFDAPENVAIAIMGWLYGGDDFGKALCLTVSYGEDTDCTAASLGALMGIICGASKIPEKWTKPLDDKIATLCIDNTSKGLWIPKTTTELSERILRMTPYFLGVEHCDLFHDGGYVITCKSGDDLFCKHEDDYLPFINVFLNTNKQLPVRELTALSPYVARYEHLAFHVMVDYYGSSGFKTGENRKFKVTIMDTGALCQQQWIRMQLYLPEGVVAVNGKNRKLPLNILHKSKAEAEFELDLEEFEDARLELILDISLEGRHTSLPIKIMMNREA
jgi:hypothetical protein